MRSELGIPEDATVLAHVARVDPMKDHGSFLAAMKELPDLFALLVGAGTENLPAAGNVLRLGRRHDVARLFAAADFAVSSSGFGEGFSNALAEGMACGLPADRDRRRRRERSSLAIPAWWCRRRIPRALAAAIRTLAAGTCGRARRPEDARARPHC